MHKAHTHPSTLCSHHIIEPLISTQNAAISSVLYVFQAWSDVAVDDSGRGGWEDRMYSGVEQLNEAHHSEELAFACSAMYQTMNV